MRTIVADDRIRARKYVFDSKNKSVEYVNGTPNRINIATNPRFTSTSGVVEVRRNLFVNPRAASNSGWEAYMWGISIMKTVLSGVSDHPLGITTAHRMTTTASGTVVGGWYFGTSATILPLAAETTYVASVYLRPSTSRVISPRFQWRKSDGTSAGNGAFGTSVACPAGVWTRVSIIGTSPADTAYADINFYTTSGDSSMWSVGDTLDATGAMVERSTILSNYFDGSYSPDPDLQPVWVGATDGSQSYLRGFVPTNTNNNVCRGVTSSRGIRQIPSGFSNDSHSVVAGSTSSLTGQGVTFTPGKWYGVSAIFYQESPQKSSALTRPRSISLSRGRPSGEWWYKTVTTANVAGEQPLSMAFRCEDNVTWQLIALRNGSSDPSDVVYWDRLLLVEGDSEAEVQAKLEAGYFDGNTIIIR